jgi:hypothetical protein
MPTFVSDRRMAGYTAKLARTTHELRQDGRATLCSRDLTWVAVVPAPTHEYPLCDHCRRVQERRKA